MLYSKLERLLKDKRDASWIGCDYNHIQFMAYQVSQEGEGERLIKIDNTTLLSL